MYIIQVVPNIFYLVKFDEVVMLDIVKLFKNFMCFDTLSS